MTQWLNLDQIDFAKGDGLVSVTIQDARSGEVLTVAFADREALEATQQTGQMHLHSRSRGLWHKGATSGNTQDVVTLKSDCDNDAVLARVIPHGPACHNNTSSCFDDRTEADSLSMLDAAIAHRAASMGDDPSSYTQRLLSDRNLRLKKIGEEAAEFLLASADNDVESLVDEAADLVYHLTVALHAHGKSFDDVRNCLWERSPASGGA